MASSQPFEPRLWWQHVGERASQPYAACPEIVKKRVECTVEQHAVSGEKWRRCTEVIQKFRACQGREPEEVSYTISETALPCEANAPGPSVAHSQQVVTSQVGQALDEFFQYVSELEKSLESTGALESHHQQSMQQSGSSAGILSRWFGKKPPPQAAPSPQPPLSGSELYAPFAYPAQEI